MARLLIWLLLGGVVWWLWRSRQRPPATKTPQPGTPPAPRDALPMLRCHRCGVHLPAADAVTDDAGHAYCSVDHRRLGPPTP